MRLFKKNMFAVLMILLLTIPTIAFGNMAWYFNDGPSSNLMPSDLMTSIVPTPI